MTDKDKQTEEAVFTQELAEDELHAVSGGAKAPYYLGCDESSQRWIYAYNFPNCASTVEEGSWCSSSDACSLSAIVYRGMENCGKAWK